MVLHFWETGLVPIPSEWEIGKLKILPKKGDLTNPGNHRVIMMLEVSYKIGANILKSGLLSSHSRLLSEKTESTVWRPGSCF